MLKLGWGRRHPIGRTNLRRSFQRATGRMKKANRLTDRGDQEARLEAGPWEGSHQQLLQEGHLNWSFNSEGASRAEIRVTNTLRLEPGPL